MNIPQVSKEGIIPPKEAKVPNAGVQQPKEMTADEKFSAFKKVFPNFGKDEFMLANDDLYPDWKKSIAPNGSWNDFLNTYGQFIQWWNDAGSPPEPGLKLWKDFVSSVKKH